MTRLEKYLLNEAKGVTRSQTTMSRYIAIDNLIIRLSDHYSIEADVDIQIIYSVNKSDIYSVFVKGNTKILHYNGKQIKEFIKSYALIKEMCSITRPPKEEVKEEVVKLNYTPITNIPLLESKIPKDKLPENQYAVVFRPKGKWHSVEIATLPELFAREYNENVACHKLAVKFKEFIMESDMSYREVLTMYCYFRDNKVKFGSDNMKSIFNRLASRN